ncbi:hybrid sensor histidine kinase/response regulator [Campylobacter sp. CX2-8023-23]|uniref:hybrid sensor histidine kinase/response regulator n=1 Tax=Campylobacter porcelli TaxID=1660073 RepID=UPI002EA0E277|nr:hybrid sensor histidine kinase/response regulator [Campylobacter sp. CX2-8023-23]
MRLHFGLLGILRLIATIPLCIIFFLSSWYLVRQYDINADLKDLKSKFIISLDLVNLSKELDKEMIINDTTSKNINRQITDHAIEHIKSLHYNQKSIEPILNKLNTLFQIRYKLDNSDFNKSEISSYFRDINLLIKDDILKLRNYDISHRINIFILAFASSYSNTIAISAKRDLVANIINYRSLSDQELLLWLELIRNNKLDYSHLPSSQAKNTIESILTSNEYKQAIDNLSAFAIEIIKYGLPSGYLGQKYYDLISDELKFAYQIQEAIISQIKSEIDNFSTEILFDSIIAFVVWLISIVLILTSYYTKNYIRANINNLSKIIKKIKSVSSANLSDGTQENSLENGHKIINEALDRIIAQKDIAQSDSRSKTAFLTNISHEIKAPLNGIMGFIDLLKSRSLGKDEKELIDIIEHSSQTLLKAINNIINMAKIEAGESEIYESEFVLYNLFDEIITSYFDRLIAKNLSLTYYIDPELMITAFSDEEKIRQIAINLIDNAIKFTPNGGKINIYAKKISSTNSDISFDFIVKDNGIGIAQNAINKIFDSFYVDENLSRTYGGTGLGLSIINHYAKMLNSKINVQSQLKNGSEFSLNLTLKLRPHNDKNYANIFKGSKVSINKNDIDEENLEIINLYLKYLGVAIELNATPVIGKFKGDKNPKNIEYQELNHGFSPSLISLINALLNSLKSTQKYNLKILIATNDTSKKIKEMFEEICANVDVVYDGKSLYELTLINHYDAIFTDIALNKQNAIIATTNIINTQDEKDIERTPIIVMLSSPKDKINKTNLLFDYYLQKPFFKSQIIEILSSIDNKDPLNALDDTRDILLLKKSKMENRIYQAVLSKICHSIDSTDSLDELEEIIQNRAYKLILIDYGAAQFDFKRVLNILKTSYELHKFMSKMVLFIEPNIKIPTQIKTQFAKILNTNISKSELENQIKELL